MERCSDSALAAHPYVHPRRYNRVMDRRTFVGVLAAGIIAVPLAARAQTATTVRRIGVLSGGAPATPAVRQGIDARLRELGWVEGGNLLIERRYANGRAELLQPLAEELVRLKVEVIATSGTQAAVAAKNATTSIPIVMFGAGDPVRTGLVASLARPDGNITGYSIVSTELEAKRLALLREVLPAAQRVGVLVNSTNPISAVVQKETEPVYRSLGMQPIIIAVARESELENAVAEIARRRAQALVVGDDALFFGHRVSIMNAALRYGLPTLVEDPEMLKAGAVLSYSVSPSEQYRRYAAFVDKILRGAKPADLPIEQPTQFELGINLKTAKALAMTIPNRCSCARTR
jgi:putative ABC transport system substrate-binding protein